MNIYGEKVILRAIEPEDLEAIREMTNDPEMEKMIIGWSYPTAKRHQQNWYERMLNDQRNFRFAVEYDNTFVGIATLVNIDIKNRSAHHGIRLTVNAPKGIGIGTDAVFAIMKYAFEELQLNRLYGSILDYNTASWKLYTKCGWKSEGLYKQSVFKNNEYHDESPVAILRNEYFEWKKAFMVRGGGN